MKEYSITLIHEGVLISGPVTLEEPIIKTVLPSVEMHRAYPGLYW
jgi:hypothetical protein